MSHITDSSTRACWVQWKEKKTEDEVEVLKLKTEDIVKEETQEQLLILPPLFPLFSYSDFIQSMCPVNTDQSTEGAGQTMMSDKRRVLLQHTKAATGGAIVHPVPTHRLPHGRRRDFTTVRLTLFHIQTIRLMVHVSVDRLSFIIHSLVINSLLIFIKLKFRNTASCQHLRHHNTTDSTVTCSKM